MGGGGTSRGALQYQMDTGVRLTLPKAGAFGENTVSKYEGSLGENPNFGSKLGGALGDSSAENRGSLESYIRVTSIMGVPPQNFTYVRYTGMCRPNWWILHTHAQSHTQKLGCPFTPVFQLR